MLLINLYREGLVSKNLSPNNMKFASLWVFIIETWVRLDIGSYNIYNPCEARQRQAIEARYNQERHIFISHMCYTCIYVL